MDRFWAKVRKTDTCWLWTAFCDDQGYGRFSLDGRSMGAHIASWKIHFGDPGGLCVLHTCDTPGCVRPDHLFLGTNRDNVDDKMRKGRHTADLVVMRILGWTEAAGAGD